MPTISSATKATNIMIGEYQHSNTTEDAPSPGIQNTDSRKYLRQSTDSMTPMGSRLPPTDKNRVKKKGVSKVHTSVSIDCMEEPLRHDRAMKRDSHNMGKTWTCELERSSDNFTREPSATTQDITQMVIKNGNLIPKPPGPRQQDEAASPARVSRCPSSKRHRKPKL